MLTVLFTKTVENRNAIETVLVAERKSHLFPITKTEYKNNSIFEHKYMYQIDEWVAFSNTDIDVLEALKHFFEEKTNVPEDFEFGHP